MGGGGGCIGTSILKEGGQELGPFVGRVGGGGVGVGLGGFGVFSGWSLNVGLLWCIAFAREIAYF